MEGADGVGILVARVGEGHHVVAHHGHIHDLVHQARLGAVEGLGLHVIVVDEGVHLVDSGLQVLTRLLVLGQTAGVHGVGSGLAVHDVDLRGRSAQRERVVVVALRTAQHVVGRGGAAPEGNLHHGQAGGLDGVNQGLAQAQQLGDLGVVADVDAGGVLNPDHGDAVTGAERDELVHLNQALAVQLAARTHRLAVFLHLILRIVGEHALLVGYHAHQKAVQLGKARNHFGTVALLVLHKLAAVEQAAQDGIHLIRTVLVVQHQVVQLAVIHGGRLGRVNTEELQVEGGEHIHILLDGGNDALLLGVHLAEEAGLAVMNGYAARRVGPEALGGLDLGQSRVHVHMGLGVHAAHDARAADRHVGLLMGQQDGGADGVVAAAGRVGAVDAYDDRDAQLVQLGVAVEGSAAAPAVGVHQLLLIQLHAGALQQINQRNAQPLGRVAAADQIVRLAGHPGAGVLLVVRGDDDTPLAVDPAQTLHDGGGAVLVVLGIIEAVQGAPRTGVHQQGDPLHGSQLALLVHVLV